MVLKAAVVAEHQMLVRKYLELEFLSQRFEAILKQIFHIRSLSNMKAQERKCKNGWNYFSPHIAQTLWRKPSFKKNFSIEVKGC